MITERRNGETNTLQIVGRAKIENSEKKLTPTTFPHKP